MANEPAIGAIDRLQRSSRDVTTLPAVISRWLSSVLPGGAAPEVTVKVAWTPPACRRKPSS